MNNSRFRRHGQRVLMGLLLVGMMLSLTSCIVGTPTCEMFTQFEQQIGHQPAETLARERGYYGVEQKWSGMAPALVVIATADDLLRIKPYIMEQSYASLTKLNFTTQFAIVSFSGEQYNDGYVFCATSWLHTEHAVTVFIHLIQQPIMAPMLASYYAIFQITKGENWHGNFTVQLQYTQHKLYVNAYDHEINGFTSMGIVAKTVTTQAYKLN
ncbi:MAG: hypothetical protein R3C14_51260 [Caldilineaceae bacterium]